MSSRSIGQSRLRAAARRLATPAAVVASLGLLWPTTLATSTVVAAKTPGKTYCYYRTCHRVMTLDETRRAVGKRSVLHASHYDDPWKDRFNPRNLTSSGEWFQSGRADNAASPKLPNGTVLLAWNPTTKGAAILRINNAGPYWGNRTLDVSRGAAEKLGFARKGVATLHTKIVAAPTKEDATYRKGRRYAAVPGFIGLFESIDHALLEAGRSIHRLISPPVHLIAGRDPEPTYPREIQPTRPGVLVADARGKRRQKAPPATVVAAAAPTPSSPPARASITRLPADAPAAAPATTPLALSGATIAAAASLTRPPAAVMAEAPVAGPSGMVAPAASPAAAVAKARQAAPRSVAASARPAAKSKAAQPVAKVAAKPAPKQAARVAAAAATARPATKAATRVSQVTPTSLRDADIQRRVVRPLPRPQPANYDDDEDDDRPVRVVRRQTVATVPTTVRRPVTAAQSGYTAAECLGWPRSTYCDRPRASPAVSSRGRIARSSANRE